MPKADPERDLRSSISTEIFNGVMIKVAPPLGKSLFLLCPPSPRVPRHYPAELLCLLVCRCPSKGKKPWEANRGFFVLIVPPEKELTMS